MNLDPGMRTGLAVDISLLKLLFVLVVLVICEESNGAVLLVAVDAVVKTIGTVTSHSISSESIGNGTPAIVCECHGYIELGGERNITFRHDRCCTGQIRFRQEHTRIV